MDHVVIIFMAGVLVHLLTGIGLSPWNSGRPGLRPCSRILDRELVVERSRVDAREALGDTESLGIGSLKNHAVVGPEIGGLNDQRRALPMSAGIAQPLVEILSDMRP